MNDQERINEMLSDSHVSKTLEKADQALQHGMTILWKWTCSHCGERVTSEQENDLYAYYIHEDCGHDTKTVHGDLGFAVMFSVGKH